MFGPKRDEMGIRQSFITRNYIVCTVAKNTISRLVYLLARETFLIEDLWTMYPYPTQQPQRISSNHSLKEEKKYLRTFMEQEPWSTGIGQQQTLKCDTRWQDLQCNNPSFHEPSDSCKRTLCDQLCERYHLERCKKRTRSIKDYASQGTSVKQ